MSKSNHVDLVIKSDRTYAWSYGGVVKASLAIDGGKIVAFGSEANMPKAEKVIDATGQGKLVMPGWIDTHAHFRDPGFTHKEDFETGSRAAAAGGVTLTVDMPNVNPPPNTLERFEAKKADAKTKAIVDFGHNASGVVPEEIPKIAKAGAFGFKIFQLIDVGRDYPHMSGTGIRDEGHLFQCFKAVSKTGLVCLVHPNNQAIYEVIAKEYMDRGEVDHRGYARAFVAYQNIAVLAGISTLILLQRSTGVKLHILHVNLRRAWEMIRDARGHGQDISTEVNPASLFLTNSWDTIEKWGPLSLGSYCRPEDSVSTWDALNDGTATVIATDHAPHHKSEKEIGWTNMFKSPGGRPMIQEYMGLMLDSVNKGIIPLEKAIQLCSENVARRFGVFPKKGSLDVGADADITIADLKKKHTYTQEEVLSKCGYTCFEGREVQGFPVMTIVRGRIVMQEGAVIGKPGEGEFVSPLSHTVLT
ncbi:MAG: dihydroorotase family protein [Thaumarchaeota archaeon]|nr:dihydroorotase family protein [Nitrososphaerota archaeon]